MRALVALEVMVLLTIYVLEHKPIICSLSFSVLERPGTLLSYLACFDSIPGVTNGLYVKFESDSPEFTH